MTKTLSLRRNFIWAFGGNIVSSFCMWLLLILLTKMASVETVGDFGVAQAVALPISMFFSLKLQLAQVTDAKNEFDFGHYYSLRIITSILTVLVTGIIGFSFYSLNMALIIIVLSSGYAVMAFREVFLAVLQKNERMDLIAVSRVLQGFLSVLFFAGLFLLTKKLFWSILGLAVARIIILLFYDYPISKKLLKARGYIGNIKPHWHLDIIWNLIKTTAPLGIVAWLATLFVSLPRLFLDKFCGREDVGYFAAISSLLVAGTLVVAALSQVVSPRLAVYYAENIKAYKMLLNKLILVGIGLGTIGIIVVSLAGKVILQILFTPEYAQHNNVFIVLVIAGAFLILFSFMNVGLTAARKFIVQVPLYTFSAITCCIFSFYLIPRYGMIGAAVSLIICYVIGLIGCSYYVMKAIKLKSV